jgi:tetraacyldisaccharide 4'-kinase
MREALWRGERPLLSLSLWPLEQLYRLGTLLDRRLGRRRAERVDVPVLSVGNLVAGGAGKTPVTLLLARRLLAAGRRVGVVSRGYGRESRGLLVVSNDEGAIASACEVGDEPVLLARKEPRLVVAVAERRIEAARACVSLGCDVIVMDDGFSHHRMHRDLDVLVVDADLGFGNGRLLPAGPLREPLDEARRAGLVWLSRVREGDSDVVLPHSILEAPTIRSGWRPVGLSDSSLRVVEPLSGLRGARVAAFCAIARPESFRRTLSSLEAELVHFESFPDHYRPSAEAMSRFRASAKALGADRIVCTEKDLARLAPTEAEGLLGLAMEAQLVGDKGPLDAALARLLERSA